MLIIKYLTNMLKIEVKTEKVHGFLVIIGKGIGKGGLRMTSSVTMDEVQRLAEVMEKKVKYYNLPYTGAKAGIVWDGKENKKKLIKEFFTQLNNMGIFPAHYSTAPDINTSSEDMDYIASIFGFNSATRKRDGIPHGTGLTGYGVGLTVEKALGSLKGKTITISGYGCVGSSLAHYCGSRDAKVMVADTDKEKLERAAMSGFILCDPKTIHSIKADAYVPCAASDIINIDNCSEVKTKLIVEGGNCQVSEEAKKILAKKKVKIIPDYVANAGGVISSHCELLGKNAAYAYKVVKNKFSRKK